MLLRLSLLTALLWSPGASAAETWHGVEAGLTGGALPSTLAFRWAPGLELRGALDFTPNLGLAFQLNTSVSGFTNSLYQGSHWWIRPAALFEVQFARQHIRLRSGLGLMLDTRATAFRSDGESWTGGGFGAGALLRAAIEIPVHERLFLSVHSQLALTNFGLSTNIGLNVGWVP